MNESKLNATTLLVCSAFNYSSSISSLNYSINNLISSNTSTNSRIDSVNSSANIKLLGFNLTTELNNLYYLATNPSGFTTLTLAQVVASIGNWSLDKPSYNTTTQLYSIFLNITDQRYNDSARIDSLNSTKANIGNCPAGQVVMNTTTSGVQCVVVSATLPENASLNSLNLNYLDMNNSWKYFANSGLLEDDMLGTRTTTGQIWSGTAINSGTTTTSVGYFTHPGTVSFRSSNTASSGYAYQTGASMFQLIGGESTDIIFNKQARTGTANISIAYLGFVDATSGVDSTDGVYLYIRNLTVWGKTRVNNVEKNTTTNINITWTNTDWYRVHIDIINSTQANFYLYNSTTQTGTGNTALLWQDNITGTLPNESGRQTGHGWITWVVGGTTASDLLIIDYANIKINRALNR